MLGSQNTESVAVVSLQPFSLSLSLSLSITLLPLSLHLFNLRIHIATLHLLSSSS